jgi:hypothetical protein
MGRQARGDKDPGRGRGGYRDRAGQAGLRRGRTCGEAGDAVGGATRGRTPVCLLLPTSAAKCRAAPPWTVHSPHASPLTPPTTLGSSHIAPAAHARITIRRDFIRRHASYLLLLTARMTAAARSRTRRRRRRRRRRHEVRTRFDVTRPPGGSCEHSARRYSPTAKPPPANGASGLGSAASAPRIPTPRRVLVMRARLALVEVMTNVFAGGAFRFLVVDRMII